MYKSRGHRRFEPQLRVIANHMIRFPEVRVLGEAGEVLGVMPATEAQRLAREQYTDLVLVTEKAQPPIVKIIDIAKFKYQLKQKESESRKKSKAQDIKEVRFTPFIGEADFQVKLRKVEEFLKKGDKVRLTLEFRGRAITKKDVAFTMFANIFQAMDEISAVEIEPKMVGRKLIAQLMPAKKSKKKETIATTSTINETKEANHAEAKNS
jgi:translation initiation factor IF-3